MSFFVHYVSLRYSGGTANKRPNLIVHTREELERMRKQIKAEYKCHDVAFVYTTFEGDIPVEELKKHIDE